MATQLKRLKVTWQGTTRVRTQTVTIVRNKCFPIKKEACDNTGRNGHYHIGQRRLVLPHFNIASHHQHCLDWLCGSTAHWPGMGIPWIDHIHTPTGCTVCHVALVEKSLWCGTAQYNGDSYFGLRWCTFPILPLEELPRWQLWLQQLPPERKSSVKHRTKGKI